MLAELFAAAALGVASLHWTAVDHALVVSTLVQVGMTTLLNSAVLLPLNYRFGYEKAKYAFYLMVGLVAALMGFGVSANEDGLARNLLPQGVPPLALLGIVLIVLGLYSLSWKSQIAGILFGVAMGVLFSVSLGTVGFALGASLANLGMVMFEGLDDPLDKK